MKKLFLHIGFNKTGSTSIQHYLSRNAAALETAGVLYPSPASGSGYFEQHKHAPLAKALAELPSDGLKPAQRTAQAQMRSSFLEDCARSPAEIVILSSEGLSLPGMTARHVQQIRQHLSGFEVSVIGYIRRQDRYLPSLYQQSIRQGGTQRFSFSQLSTRRQLSFAPRLAPWREIFGAQNVTVRPFDPQFWPEGGLIEDFLAAAGIPATGLPAAGQPANVSLDTRGIELMRLFNETSRALWPKHAPEKRKRLRSTLLGAMRRMPENEIQKMVLSTDQAETLRAQYRADNEAALEGSGISASDFFPSAQEDRAACLPPESLPPETVMQLAAGLMTAPARKGKKAGRKPRTQNQ